MEYSTIRVLHVFTIMNRGGAESMIMNYYRNIDKSKVQFDFLVHRQERGVFEDEIERLGGKVYRMPPINPLFPKKYYQELDKFLKNYIYTVIHSHINTFSSFPLKVARENKVSCRIAHAHTTTLPVTFNLIFKKSKDAVKILFKDIQKHKVKKEATHLMTCGENSGDWLFGNADYRIIPNAIDTRQYVYNEQKSKILKDKYNLTNHLVLGHIGNFSYPKNYPFILSVFKEIKNLRQNSKLVLIGDGILRREVEDRAKSLDLYKDIVFLGIRSDVPNLLQMIDVFLFPSHYEGLPVTLVEAQAAGLKIIASDAITSEVALTDDIQYLSLDLSAQQWAEEVLKSVPHIRKDNSIKLMSKGYDVVESAKQLESFYLDQFRINN